jgi:acetyltransferase
VSGGGESWKTFFDPRGVVVVGASLDVTKLGHGIARNLTQGGFAGFVYLVNPNASGRLFGRRFYASVAEVPDPVDLAVILVRSDLVPGILDACGSRGISAAIVVAGGFRETGPRGAEIEEQCLTVAREHGIRFLGPNCIGTIDTHGGLNTTFLAPPGPAAGDLAFISHSGALCAAVIDWSAGQGFGFSRLVSLGNQADINETEALQMVADDPRTQVVTAYLESLDNGRAFIDQVARMRQPVVVLKVGRQEGGRRAVASHTGAMAGRDDAFRAAFQRAGVVTASTLEAMFDAARTLAWAPLPAGRAVAVLTNAGGPGVAAVDALEHHGLSLAEISVTTRTALGDALPPAAGLDNPIDMLASAGPRDFGRCLQILVEAPEVDALMVVFAPPPMYAAGEVARAVVEVARAASKPILVTVMGERSIGPAVEQLRAARIPDFRFPEPAAAALGVLAGRVETVAAEPQPPVRPDGIETSEAASAVAASQAGWLGPGTAADMLESYGIGVPRGVLVSEAGAAVRAAAGLGGRVALKLVAGDLSHKSDVGGLRLGLAGEGEIRRAYSDLMAVAGELSGSSASVYLQEMVEGFHDLVVGAVRDPQFGPLLMFGSGGIEIEGLGDVEFALAPSTEKELDHLLACTWAGRRLNGYRSIPGGDVEAVKDVMRRVGWLLEDHSDVIEVEINPLRALAEGSGAVALDVRIRIE